MPRAGIVRAVAAAVLAALVAGCTSTSPEPAPTPSPSPTETAAVGVGADIGARIAVIVPPRSVVATAEAAALLHAADDLAATPPDGVASVRVVQATSEPFVRDLANLAVDDGLDLVCVVGTGSAELVLELARARRDGRFCTTDGRIAGGPVNVVSVGVDPGSLVEAGAVAIGTAPAPVGLVLSPQLGEAEALIAAFTAAVAPPRQPTPSPDPSPTTATEASGDTTSSAATTATASPDPGSSPDPGPSPGPSPTTPGPSSQQPPFVTITAGAGSAAQTSAGEQLAAERPSRALVLTTPGGAGAARAAAAAGTEVVVVSDWSVDQEGEAPPNLLVALTVDWAALLRRAIAAGRMPEAPQVQLLGITDGVLDAVPGQAEGAVAAAERATEHLRRSSE